MKKKELQYRVEAFKAKIDKVTNVALLGKVVTWLTSEVSNINRTKNANSILNQYAKLREYDAYVNQVLDLESKVQYAKVIYNHMASHAPLEVYKSVDVRYRELLKIQPATLEELNRYLKDFEDLAVSLYKILEVGGEKKSNISIDYRYLNKTQSPIKALQEEVMSLKQKPKETLSKDLSLLHNSNKDRRKPGEIVNPNNLSIDNIHKPFSDNRTVVPITISSKDSQGILMNRVASKIESLLVKSQNQLEGSNQIMYKGDISPEINDLTDITSDINSDIDLLAEYDEVDLMPIEQVPTSKIKEEAIKDLIEEQPTNSSEVEMPKEDQVLEESKSDNIVFFHDIEEPDDIEESEDIEESDEEDEVVLNKNQDMENNTEDNNEDNQTKTKKKKRKKKKKKNTQEEQHSLSSIEDYLNDTSDSINLLGIDIDLIESHLKNLKEAVQTLKVTQAILQKIEPDLGRKECATQDILHLIENMSEDSIEENFGLTPEDIVKILAHIRRERRVIKTLQSVYKIITPVQMDRLAELFAQQNYSVKTLKNILGTRIKKEKEGVEEVS